MDFKSISLWICILVVALPELFFGFQKIRQNPEISTNFARWGISQFFMICIGIAEIGVGIGLLIPAARLYSIYVMAIILVGAIFTHLKAKDKFQELMPPLFVSALLLTIYFLQMV